MVSLYNTTNVNKNIDIFFEKILNAIQNANNIKKVNFKKYKIK